MSEFSTSVWSAIDFPDSGWSLSFQRQGSEVVLSLHWREKFIPTHQVKVSVENFKDMLETINV